MDNGKKQTAYLFIGAGLYLVIGHLANFIIANALVLAALGYAILKASKEEGRKETAGYALLAIAFLILLANHWGFMFIVVAAVAAWLFFRMKSTSPPGKSESFSNVKQHVVANIRWGWGEAWTARSSDISAAIAEVRIDLTTAFFEEKRTAIRLQGLIGDVDIVVPEDIGLTVNAQVAVGEIQVAGERGSGFANHQIWRSPNADTAEYRVDLEISYIIADVGVKVL